MQDLNLQKWQKIAPDAFNKEGSLTALGGMKTFDDISEAPGFGVSALTALMPVILMAVTTVVELVQEMTGAGSHVFFDIIKIIGQPTTALLISLLIAVYTMGIARKIPMTELMKSAESSIRAISMILLITGAGGALKQVLIDGGVGDSVAALFSGSAMSPLVLSWLIAAVLRIAPGSATVAALTTAGLVIPLMQGSDVNMALMVLATGAGSLIASHVNDTGFWIFKEYFDLTMKETFATWTLLETVISVSGLVFVLILSIFV